MIRLASLLSVLLSQNPAQEAHEEAGRLLEAGNAPAAEAKAREAISLSLRFVPEEEIATRPEKGVLLDEMILEARRSYRERRSLYFRLLGESLAAQEKWRASRKALRRAMEVAADPAIPLLVAEHEDLDVAARVDLLLEAYLASGSDRSAIEERLLASGAFRTRNALQASLDRKRFPELRQLYPEISLHEAPFPEFQAVTDAGTLIPEQLFRTGATLIVYSPAEGCQRCSEELDALASAVEEPRREQIPIEVAAFVRESDLPVARRIARLLGIPIGIGRAEGLPPTLSFEPGGEIRFAARGGLTRIQLPLSELSSSAEIRRRLEAILSFLDLGPPSPQHRPEEASEPLVTLSRGPSEQRTFLGWIEAVEKLEAGPAPLHDLYAELNRQAQGISSGRDRAGIFELLQAVSRLKGANSVKMRLLGSLGARIGERLLERAKGMDSAVIRTPAGERGAFHVAISEGSLLLQRSFEAADGLRHFDFVLEDDGTDLQVAWGSAQERAPRGVFPTARGAAFLYACAPPAEDPCRGARLVADGSILFEGEPVAVLDGNLVEVLDALVDPVGDGPRFHRPAGAGGETALEKGLEAFRSGQYAAAAEAFAEAAGEIDPEAPYDASDLLYNRARALEEQGMRQEALALYRGLGDVSYQDRVDERARAIESGR